MQTENPFFDGLAKFFTDAAGAANALRDEIDTFVRQRLERLAADMDLVPREEFEAVKAMAAKARSENEALAMRVAELEKRSAGGGPSLGTVGTKTA
ncbi:MAG TPA: accessory factor UbiK family protein [Rhizomicrobium sp.]|jgi:BMFP domain-containing protein YqiC|nr:accessory factor UbiK family protein [Rhizomicrobium sp.]